jgi:hypothetical protein
MKQIILFLSLLFTVQIGTAQETWNACNSTVTVIPAPSYDSTFVLEAPSRAALQKGMANWVPASSGGSASYLVYTALLSQSGTSAPTATILRNTLSGTPLLSYIASGEYHLTLTGAFPANKVFAPNVLIYAGGVSILRLNRIDDDAIELFIPDGDDLGVSFQVEIRVYP